MAKVAASTKVIPPIIIMDQSLGAVMREKYSDDGLFETDINLGTFKTGFPTLDYALGFPVDIYNKEDWIRRDIMKGVLVGSYFLIVGETFTGKSTAAIQIASNIIRPYENSNVYHIDLERATSDISRIIQISKLPRADFDILNPNRRYIIRQSPTDHDTIQKIVLRYYKEKMANKDKYLIKLGQYNSYGDEIVAMIPTVIIIDSIPMISNALDINDSKDAKKLESILSQMDAAQTAGQFKRMMKTILGPMKEANIIVIGISHMGTKIQSNPMIHNKKDFRGLGADEMIAGGRMNTYGATNIIKTDRRGGKGYLVENGDGFNGFDGMITLVKTRTTFDAKQVPMIYDCENGFDPIRSMIQYAIERGIITGNRASMKFTNDPECKFSYVKLYDELRNKPAINENIKKFIIPDLESDFKIEKPPESIMNIFMDY
jgi:hypothetical protein